MPTSGVLREYPPSRAWLTQANRGRRNRGLGLGFTLLGLKERLWELSLREIAWESRSGLEKRNQRYLRYDHSEDIDAIIKCLSQIQFLETLLVK